MDVKIIYEDKHVIIAEKPPKMPSQSDKTKDLDMVTYLEQHIVEQSKKATIPYVGLIQRLDRPVGGLMIFAKNKEANRFLSKQIQNKTIEKEYLAVVCGKPEKNEMLLTDFLKKSGKINMSKIVDANDPGGKKAILKCHLLETVNTEEFGTLSLVRIQLETGRHHQIRVQLSGAGLPLWGDTKYNKAFVKTKTWTQVALWSYKTVFRHPINKERMTFTSYPTEIYPFSLFKTIENQ